MSLLTPLIQTLRQRQALPQHALFVVPDSSYSSLAKNAEQAGRDTSWQQRLAGIWQQKVAAAEGAAAGAASGNPAGHGSSAAKPRANGSRAAPLQQLLGQDSRRGVAVPSLADTVRWLHRCAREQPRRQLQVCYAGIICASCFDFASCIPHHLCIMYALEFSNPHHVTQTSTATGTEL